MAGMLYCFNTTATQIFLVLNNGNQRYVFPAPTHQNWRPLALNPPITFQAQLAQNVLGYGDNALQFGLVGGTKTVPGTLSVPDNTDLGTDFQLYLTPMGSGKGSYCFLKEGRYQGSNFLLQQTAGGIF